MFQKWRSIIDAQSATAWRCWAVSHGAGLGFGRNLVTQWWDDDLRIECDEELLVVDVVAEARELE